MRRMWMKRLLAVAALSIAASPAAAQSRFADWSAAVVSADWRGARNEPIDAFDNARRDLVSALVQAGFSRGNVVDFSLRPDRPNPTTGDQALRGIGEATARTSGGCLLYFTSHGAPDAMVWGETGRLAPDQMANLVRGWCGARPTVVVVSACYSGIFVEGLKAPNRAVITAARRDRTSFGCGAGEQYPWFDACVLESFPTAPDFLALASQTRACVSRREQEAGVDLPSEPQMWVGAEMQLRLPTLRFSRP